MMRPSPQKAFPTEEFYQKIWFPHIQSRFSRDDSYQVDPGPIQGGSFVELYGDEVLRLSREHSPAQRGIRVSLPPWSIDYITDSNIAPSVDHKDFLIGAAVFICELGFERTLSVQVHVATQVKGKLLFLQYDMKTSRCLAAVEISQRPSAFSLQKGKNILSYSLRVTHMEENSNFTEGLGADKPESDKPESDERLLNLNIEDGSGGERISVFAFIQNDAIIAVSERVVSFSRENSCKYLLNTLNTRGLTRHGNAVRQSQTVRHYPESERASSNINSDPPILAGQVSAICENVSKSSAQLERDEINAQTAQPATVLRATEETALSLVNIPSLCECALAVTWPGHADSIVVKRAVIWRTLACLAMSSIGSHDLGEWCLEWRLNGPLPLESFYGIHENVQTSISDIAEDDVAVADKLRQLARAACETTRDVIAEDKKYNIVLKWLSQTLGPAAQHLNKDGAELAARAVILKIHADQARIKTRLRSRMFVRLDEAKRPYLDLRVFNVLPDDTLPVDCQDRHAGKVLMFDPDKRREIKLEGEVSIEALRTLGVLLPKGEVPMTDQSDLCVSQYTMKFRKFKLNGQTIAVKRIIVDLTTNQHALRELEINSQLHHDNVLSCLGAWLSEDEEILHIAMLMLDCSIDDLLYHPTKLKHSQPVLREILSADVDVIVCFALQMALGLNYLHKHKIMHRDVKPSNCLVDMRGPLVKLCDFGVSKQITEATLNRTDRGTIGYMAPEHKKRTAGLPADVWSFGSIIAEMMAGQRPRNEQPAFEQEVLLKRDRWLTEEVVNRCLAKQPKDRPTAEELVEILSDWLLARDPEQTSSPASILGEQLGRMERLAEMVKDDLRQGGTGHPALVNFDDTGASDPKGRQHAPMTREQLPDWAVMMNQKLLNLFAEDSSRGSGSCTEVGTSY